jgi:acyl-CoA reductase-like NAD-dependent aldehyde dehydrogenase
MTLPTFFPLIHNKWIRTRHLFKVKNPYNNKVIGKVYQADEDFLDLAIESAQKGFHFSRQLSGFDRFTILTRISNGIQKRTAELSEIITKESGKPIHLARNEVARAQLTFSWAAEESRRINGDYLPLDVAPQTRYYNGIVKRFPVGIILGISPFNFPLNLVAHKVAPAIASGNSIILKPASYTPITALILGDIIKEAEVPPGIVNILPISGKSAEYLVKDGRIKKLSFTGSAEVGWYLKSIAGKKHVTLELGGNAAAIIEPDIDFHKIIPRLVQGSFAYAGQICISVQRIYVHSSIFNHFMEAFLIETKRSAKLGDPMNDAIMMGPMIDLKAAQKIEKWIYEATKRGAKILMGGKRHKNFIDATVLTNTSADMKVVCEEVFAPVVSINPYNDLAEAIQMVNNSHYGLQSSIFTHDIRKIQKAYNEIEVGAIIVNDYPTFRIDPMPYGGIKDSGFGREGIKYAIEEMTELKLIVIKGGND